MGVLIFRELRGSPGFQKSHWVLLCIPRDRNTIKLLAHPSRKGQIEVPCVGRLSRWWCLRAACLSLRSERDSLRAGGAALRAGPFSWLMTTRMSAYGTHAESCVAFQLARKGNCIFGLFCEALNLAQKGWDAYSTVVDKPGWITRARV